MKFRSRMTLVLLMILLMVACSNAPAAPQAVFASVAGTPANSTAPTIAGGTDAVPTGTYVEPPLLADRVASGNLPPINRCSADRHVCRAALACRSGRQW